MLNKKSSLSTAYADPLLVAFWIEAYPLINQRIRTITDWHLLVPRVLPDCLRYL